ncbi:carboxymuconolactone decarboxylase family protein [Aurantiacibacter xanthus]|uniref:Carboxymuconolactone decarboxylase family protein n=1 Tax=Aurantiacibacter xanthus TaxID=1784712 RepID=A0A3A1P9X0_9SPHN|nr:carboxymuconolactone decarboxylase family protein [Aurantiacibacter xanthus]RIV89728.1 carboxymuconolactone decarboxylase family protein [Aurantiacibacter xanthus]
MSIRIDYEKVAPAGYKALGGVYSYVSQSDLDEVLVDLVYLRVSQINGCAYCLDLHTRDLVRHGVAPEKLALVQVWDEAGPVFTERERAALRWAETVTLVAQTAIPDSDFQAVAAVFTEKEIADLTIAIGIMNAFNRLSVGFRRPPRAALAAAE